MSLNKDVLFGQEVRNKIQEGANILANAVKSTLGPKGRNVVIEKGPGYPHSTKDGVSVAREFFFEDHYMNLGAQMLKQVAARSADKVADGTTTSTVLAQAMLNEGNKGVASGLNPIFIKKGMEEAVKDLIEEVKNNSKPVSNTQELKAVASISANNDEEIGSLVSEAIEKVGKYGEVTLAESESENTYLDFTKGWSFDQGYATPYLINDLEHLEAVYENPYVLLVDKELTNFNLEVLPFLERVLSEQKFPLVILATDYKGDVPSTLIQNILPQKTNRTTLPIAWAKAPGFGARRAQMMQDIAILTGATLVTEDAGLRLQEVTTAVLGRCDKVRMKQFETILVGGAGNKEDIDARIAYLKQQAEITPSDYDREKNYERISKMTGGIAVIKVGANSDLEMKEKKDRFDDAIGATKAAREEGIVAGGGTALYNASQVLQEKLSNVQGNDTFKYGYKLVLKAAEAPIRQIMLNAGIENPDKVLSHVNLETGFDAREEKLVDLFAAGIIDPTKVVRCALENAVSVASLMITTEVAIVSADKAENIKVQQ